MFDFDIVSMIGYKIDGENNKIYQINKECHSNQIYNFFQRGITAIAAFTGGMSSAMKCFIAGTVIATETGFARIEDVKPGDIVLSTNTDTMETGCKKVLEKYVRKTRELVHIIVGGKEIVSTPDHPYYVEGRGFVNACQLCIGSPLMDADGKILEIEQIYKEQLEKNEEVTVYNFQVEDWHTYHVGEMEVLVHNAEYESGTSSLIDIDVIRPKLKTEPDTAFFWSGRTDGIGGAENAANIAKSRGGVTLESTIETQDIVMPEWDFNNPSTMEAWDLASGAYAEQVSGEIRAVIGSELRSGNIWENVELPRLKNNPNVTKITTIDPKTGVENVIFER